MNPDTLALEILSAACGVLGTFLLAMNGPRAGWGFVAFLGSNAGWIMFAWIHAHWAMLGQQIAFTATSLLGVWTWLIKPDFWDEWRGHYDGTVTMRTKHLLHVRGRKLDLHKMIAADMPALYHTHPARALRIILWGGYVEELSDGSTKAWKPGMVGLVQPELAHRISAIANGRCSYSLWIRGRKRAGVQIVGRTA